MAVRTKQDLSRQMTDSPHHLEVGHLQELHVLQTSPVRVGPSSAAASGVPAGR